MKRLLLDLRDNPGGPLDQAIRVSNRFLPKGDLIVYTQRPRAELRSGLSAPPRRATTRRCRCRARQPQQRERVGDRVGRAAGSRSRAHRRRDDVRQGARAVGLPRQRGRGPGADDRALLHAERPADSAAVGRHLRRVPHLHAARSEHRTAARREGPEATPTPAARCTAAAASSRIGGSTGRSKASTRTSSGAASTRASCSPPSRSASRPRATPASSRRARIARSSAPDFVVDDAMVAEFKKLVDVVRASKIDEQAFADRPAVHQGDDPLRHRPVALRRRGGAPAPDRRPIRRRSSR